MLKFIKRHVIKSFLINPEDLNNISEAVNKQMNDILMKFSEEFEGLLIFYKFVKEKEIFEIKDDGKMICECFLKVMHMKIDFNAILDIKNGYFLQTFKAQENSKENYKLKFEKIEISEKGSVILKGEVFEE